MRIAVVSETSAADKNPEILRALKGRGHDVVNAGMKAQGGTPELTYVHTGLMAALLLNLGRVDFAVGGCGTGQGFLNSVLQYPGIVCGLVVDPLDAWLFTLINGGNCVSLPLNKGFGWAGGENLGFIFEKLFAAEKGKGHPPHRSESQAQSRRTLAGISRIAHRPLAVIVEELPGEVIRPVLDFPGMSGLLDVGSIRDDALKAALSGRL